MGFLNNILQHPLTKGMDLDDPNTTSLRKQIIQDKPLLKHIYEEWYEAICARLPSVEGSILEIGSGAGFLKSRIPDLITSDIMPVPGNDITCNAQALPFEDNSLRAIVMVNVLHHISDPEQFFKEAYRCIDDDGAIILVEPWVSSWSRIIYSNLHHEPFNPESPSWKLPESGPLSGGNDALPWIIFERDQEKFSQKTNWYVKSVQPTMPFRYLLSGGVSMRNLLPGWMIRPLTALENIMSPKMIRKTAMFAYITLKQNK